MKKNRAQTQTERTPLTDEALLRKINTAKKIRLKLLATIEENPSAENKTKLARLEATLERDQDDLNLSLIAQVSPIFEGLVELLPRMIEAEPDELLIELGDQCFAAMNLQRIREVRNELFDSTMIISSNQQIRDFLRRLNETLDRYETRLEERRLEAAARLPALARKFRPPDYEMPAEYTQMLTKVTGLTEARDRLAKDLKYAQPSKRQLVINALAEMDKGIDECEKVLAEMYDRHQRREKYRAGLRKLVANGSRTDRDALRTDIAQNPGKNPLLERLMRDEFPEENDWTDNIGEK